jgi:uncharacterized delta-60 repeat protein
MFACAALLAYAANAFAAAGDLDPSFGSGGKVSLTVPIPVINSVGNAVVVQPDGKIVVAGTEDGNTVPQFPIVTRFNADGSLDKSFGDQGRTEFGFGAPNEKAAGLNAIALQPDGKIVVAGFKFDASSKAHMAVARLNPNGVLDSSFNPGPGGIAVNTSFASGTDSVAEAVVVKPSGKIVIVGRVINVGPDSIAYVQYNTSGGVDSNFGLGGAGFFDFDGDGALGAAAVALPDGKVVIGGETYGPPVSFALARITDDGYPDPTFGDGGGRSIPFGNPGEAVAASLALQPNGMVVAGGGFFTVGGRQIALARVDSAGNLDPAFGTGGKVLTNFHSEDALNGIALQADGKIVGVGVSSPPTEPLAARFNANGSKDTSFGSGGAASAGTLGASTIANGVALQPDGRAVAVGTSTAASVKSETLFRYLGDPAGGTGTALSSRISAPKKSKLKAKKFKKISGTAAGDGLSKVQVAILKTDKSLLKKKKRCLQVKSNKAKLAKVKAVKKKCKPSKWLTAKGTAKWSFTLKKALKPGKYTIYVRSVGAGGATQTSFSKALGNLKTVTLTK